MDAKSQWSGQIKSVMNQAKTYRTCTEETELKKGQVLAFRGVCLLSLQIWRIEIHYELPTLVGLAPTKTCKTLKITNNNHNEF